MSASLEAHYRRLIRLYPGQHRAVYADDMLAALIADAQPDQQRPRLGTTADLLRGAGQAWALRLLGRNQVWGARFPATIGLLALLLLSTRSVTAAGRLLAQLHFTPYDGWLAVVVMLPDLIWLPVLVAAVLGRRRPVIWPIWAAWVLGIGWPLLNTVFGVSGWAENFLGSPARFVWLPVALIAALSLGVDGGARQGIRALGRVRSGAALAGVVLLGLATGDLPKLTGELRNGWVAYDDGAQIYTGHDGIDWYAYTVHLIDIALPLTLVICTLITIRSTAHAEDPGLADR